MTTNMPPDGPSARRKAIREAAEHAERAIALTEAALAPVPVVLDSYAKIARRLGFISRNTLKRRVEAAYVDGVCIRPDDPLMQIIRYRPETKAVFAYAHECDALRDGSPRLADLSAPPVVKSSENLREMHRRRRASSKPTKGKARAS